MFKKFQSYRNCIFVHDGLGFIHDFILWLTWISTFMQSHLGFRVLGFNGFHFTK